MTKINIQGSAGGGGGGGVTAVAVASGTTGTDVNITGSPITSSGTITVNIPIASATNTGKISSTDWAAFNGKQAALVSGTNIKTINGNTILGSGDLVVGGGTVSSVAVATGTTGTDVSVSGSPITSSGTITVNIPIASAVNTGKLSSTDWSTFNGKQDAISLTTTGTSGAATLVGSTLNIPQYATAPGGADTNVQYNSGGSFAGSSQFNFDGTNVAIGANVGGIGSKKLTVTSSDQCVATFGNNTTGAGITFTDTTTTDAETVGVGAFGDLLCLRGDGNTAGTIQIGNDFADFKGNQLRNFIPLIDTDAVGVTINSANEDSYCGIVLEVTGAITVTIDDSVRDGFSISIIQMDANNCTLAASGGSLTLRNRQGHTQTNGQWATVTLFKNGANLILAGDTA